MKIRLSLGDAVVYSNWNHNEPSKGQSYCVTMNSATGFWSSANKCADPEVVKPFGCEVTAGRPLTAPSSIGLPVPEETKA